MRNDNSVQCLLIAGQAQEILGDALRFAVMCRRIVVDPFAVRRREELCLISQDMTKLPARL